MAEIASLILGAVVDRHAAVAIDRLGHDLQGPPRAADHPRLHQLEAHIAESRLDQFGSFNKGVVPGFWSNTKRAGASPLSSRSRRERMCNCPLRPPSASPNTAGGRDSASGRCGAPEAEEDRPASGGQGLLLVAGRRPVVRPLPPVRRPSGQPPERDSAEVAGGVQPGFSMFVASRSSPPSRITPADSVAVPGIDDPTLVVPQLGPRIGKKHEGALDCRIGQRRQEEPRVVHQHPDIVEPLRFDQRQQLRDAVDERLDADAADLRVGRRLRRQMLAATETDRPDRCAAAA